MWDVNLAQLQPTFLGMVDFPTVVGVKLKNENDRIIAANGIVANPSGEVMRVSAEGQWAAESGYFQLLEYKFPIIYTRSGEKHLVGSATLYSSYRVIFDKLKTEYFFILVNALIKTVALWWLFIWISRKLLTRPLSILTEAAQIIDFDKLDNVHIDVETKELNEIKLLENAFNGMIEKLRSRIKENIRLTNMFAKFVPMQFLKRISDGGIEEIELGRASLETATILFADIRSFTTLSERMEPQEVLDLLNSYLQQVSPPIHANGGFIDKFLGDGIMALFIASTIEAQAESSVSAAIEMQRVLATYNRSRVERGHLPFDVGIGIHTGSVIMGTIGSENRMDSTVVGDNVNFAARLEGLTKYFGVKIIISSRVKRHLASEKTGYRELDFVQVKGKMQSEIIYEVIDVDSEEPAERKRRILPVYASGLDMYRDRDWVSAKLKFEECLQICPEDVVSRIYIDRCVRYIESPPSEDWNGVVQLDG